MHQPPGVSARFRLDLSSRWKVTASRRSVCTSVVGLRFGFELSSTTVGIRCPGEMVPLRVVIDRIDSCDNGHGGGNESDACSDGEMVEMGQ